MVALYGAFYVLFFIFEEECDVSVQIFTRCIFVKLNNIYRLAFNKVPEQPKKDRSHRHIGSYVSKALPHRFSSTKSHRFSLAKSPPVVSGMGRLRTDTDYSFLSQRTSTQDADDVFIGDDDTDKSSAYLQIFMYYIQVLHNSLRWENNWDAFMY